MHRVFQTHTHTHSHTDAHTRVHLNKSFATWVCFPRIESQPLGQENWICEVRSAKSRHEYLCMYVCMLHASCSCSLVTRHQAPYKYEYSALFWSGIRPQDDNVFVCVSPGNRFYLIRRSVCLVACRGSQGSRGAVGGQSRETGGIRSAVYCGPSVSTFSQSSSYLPRNNFIQDKSVYHVLMPLSFYAAFFMLSFYYLSFTFYVNWLPLEWTLYVVPRPDFMYWKKGTQINCLLQLHTVH